MISDLIKQPLAAASAASGDFFTNITNSLKNLNSPITLLGGAVSLVALLVIGIMWMIGGSAGQKAKAWLPNVCIGIVIVLGATMIVDTVAKSVGGSF